MSAAPLEGVFAPVVTPFESGELRLDYLRSNLETLAGSSLAGYLALGSNGEFRTLNETERMRVLEVFADCKGEKIVMAGACAESTVETVRLCNQVADFGFEYASVLPPSYFAKLMRDEVLYRYFSAVADSSRVPIVLYTAPQFTGGIEIGADLALRLASHPNIAGIKDSSKPGPGALLAQLEQNAEFAVLAGSTNFFYPSLHLGATGGVLSLANAVPEACVELVRLFGAGKFPEALRQHRLLVQLNRAVSGKHGVAGVKAAVTIAGMNGGEPRPPVAPLSPEAVSELEETLRSAGVLGR